MDRKRSKKSAGRRKASEVTTNPTFRREGSWKQRSPSVLWLKLNFTIKTARLQTLKRQKYQHLQEEALLKARGLLQNWEDGVVLTEDLYSRARSEHEAQEILNYTPEALALRFSLRNHPDVIDGVKQLWSIELPRDEMGCINRQGYASLFRRVGRSLEPDASKRRLRRMEKTIQEDWVRDSKGESMMSFSNFFDSVFELADLWCETIDVDEYIAFLRRLVLRVSTMRNDKGKRLLRSLKHIKAIDDDEESSSDEEPTSEVDDEEELPSEGDSDEDDDDENVQVQLPPPVTPIHSVGFIATKALHIWHTKTPPSSAGTRSNTSEPEEDRPRSRERRASVITLGDFTLGSFGGIGSNDNEAGPKTPTGLRVSSAKSRVSSAKAPLASVRENTNATNTEDNGGVDALVAMHRLRSAQLRGPVVVEDATMNNTISKTNVSLPIQQRQQRPAKDFKGALGTPKTGIGVGSVSMDGLPTSDRLQSPLTRSTPQIKSTGGLKEGTIENVDSAQVGSGGARRTMLSSSSKMKQKKDKTSTDIVFDGEPQANKNNKRIEALGATSSSTTSTVGKTVIRRENAAEHENSLSLSSNDNQSGSHAPREYVSGSGFDSSGARTKDNSVTSIHKKAELLPVNPTLPFYTFDEDVSPAKRLLPPMQDDTGGRGRSKAYNDSSKGRQQRNAGHDGGQGLDFTDSYKTTGYLTGSLQAEILSRSGWSVAGSHNTNARSLQQGAVPLWSPLSGKESKSQTRRRTSKQGSKRTKKLATDDEYGDGTVSPWDTEFDDDNDLARAVPHSDKHQDHHIDCGLATPVSPTASKVQPPKKLDPTFVPELITLSVSSSMVPPEPPSNVSELTTLPQEYHELVLGGSAYKGLSRTVSAPVTLASPTSIQPREVHPGKTMSREPQWMLHGASKPSQALLEDGLEGRTLASSPRPVRTALTALTSKRPRRERDVDDEENIGLCPRFVEHLESHGDRAATAPSPHFRTDKLKPRCTCNEYQDDEVVKTHGKPYHCPQHGGSNNNWQENDEEYIPLEQEAEVSSHIEDVTMIVNATRGLVLRPGTMDRLAAKRARYKQQATRSEMMRRRCQYTFAKHLD